VLNVTHLGRQVTAAQRTALEARGARCERCGSRHLLDIDHNEGWTLTHDTRLEDLSWECWHCHGLKTRHNLSGWIWPEN
jgi:phage terminase large subunit GpA-like protein